MVELLLFLLVFLLAYSNGANDISKGIATLVGSGAARIQSATLWGAFTTAIGSVAAIAFGGLLLKVFSSGVLIGSADPVRIAAAVASGGSLWVFVCSRFGLPVSTTHAIIGGIIGAGIAEFGLDGSADGQELERARSNGRGARQRDHDERGRRGHGGAHVPHATQPGARAATPRAPRRASRFGRPPDHPSA